MGRFLGRVEQCKRRTKSSPHHLPCGPCGVRNLIRGGRSQDVTLAHCLRTATAIAASKDIPMTRTLVASPRRPAVYAELASCRLAVKVPGFYPGFVPQPDFGLE